MVGKICKLFAVTLGTLCLCCACNSKESNSTNEVMEMEVDVGVKYSSYNQANSDYQKICENICDCITKYYSEEGEYSRISSPIDWGSVASYSYWNETEQNRFEVDITGFENIKIFFDVDVYFKDGNAYRMIDEAIVETTDGVTKAYDIVELGVNSIWGYNQDTKQIFLIWHDGIHKPDCDCLLVQ